MDSQPIEGFIYCSQCGTYNPKDTAQCQQCGFMLTGIEIGISEDKPKPQKWRRLKPGEVYFPDQDSILPGRPLWIATYAASMATAGAICIATIGLRILGGTLLETYTNYVFVTIILAISVVSIFAAVELWQLKRRGRQLTIVLQLLWITAIIIILFSAYRTLPTTTTRTLFLEGVLEGVAFHAISTLVVLIFIHLFSVSLFSEGRAPRGSALEITETWRTIVLIYGIIGVMILSVSAFVATTAFVLEPSLILPSNSPLSIFSNFVRGGLLMTIPANALVMLGLLAEQ
jgi:hypothetical protein